MLPRWHPCCSAAPLPRCSVAVLPSLTRFCPAAPQAPPVRRAHLASPCYAATLPCCPSAALQCCRAVSPAAVLPCCPAAALPCRPASAASLSISAWQSSPPGQRRSIPLLTSAEGCLFFCLLLLCSYIFASTRWPQSAYRNGLPLPLRVPIVRDALESNRYPVRSGSWEILPISMPRALVKVELPFPFCPPTTRRFLIRCDSATAVV